MSSRITFIDNNIESGDWCVVILNGEVIHEGHEYPRGDWFVEFFKTYQGIAETVLANTMKSNATPEQLLNFAKWVLDEYS